MSEKLRVAVLMGGMSAEHEVSISSGTGVVNALDKTRYAVIPLEITQSGDWCFPNGTVPFSEASARLIALDLDCVFIALHGGYGEDGRLQGFLDMLGIPYTGSGCSASALAMDKVRSKMVMEAQGVRVAPHVAVDAIDWQVCRDAILEAAEDTVGFPCVVKPTCDGSSCGVTIARTEDELPTALDQALALGECAMVEAFVRGVEVTCGVLEQCDVRRALAVTEIRPKTATFFDYVAKYTPGETEEITPAEISDIHTEEVKAAAIRVHETIGCRGWSRSDFIIDAQGPVWIEVNTVPGMTPTSLFPQAAAHEGISYEDLVGLFVDEAIRLHQGA